MAIILYSEPVETKEITVKLQNVAKYHLGKVKLELMQPASVPIQLISFRQVKYELMQPAVSAFGST